MATVTAQQLRDLMSEFFAEHAAKFADTSEAAMPAVTEYVLLVRIDDLLTDNPAGGFYALVESSDIAHRTLGLIDMAREIVLDPTYLADVGEDDD